MGGWAHLDWQVGPNEATKVIPGRGRIRGGEKDPRWASDLADPNILEPDLREKSVHWFLFIGFQAPDEKELPNVILQRWARSLRHSGANAGSSRIPSEEQC